MLLLRIAPSCQEAAASVDRRPGPALDDCGLPIEIGPSLAASGSEPTGTLATALTHTARLLEANPRLAEAQSREILKVVPGHPQAQLLLATALRRQGDLAAAIEVLEPLARAQPRASQVHLEHGVVLAALGRTLEAIGALEVATGLVPDSPQAWGALADQLSLAGDEAGADTARARQIRASVNEPELMEAAGALCDGRLGVAERLLRDILKRRPTEIAAIRMLAEVGARLGRLEEAERLLERCLELSPGFSAARHNYATVLYRQNKASRALSEVDRLLEAEPGNPGYRNLRAASLAQVGEYAQAIEGYEAVLKSHPAQPKAWMSYGHALKTVGRQSESIEAYRRSLRLQPGLGEAYWSLANLKTFRFSAEDVEAMQRQLERTDLGEEDRLHLHYALGKALEDEARYADSFTHYREGAALRRSMVEYDADETSEHLRRSMATFTPGFFEARRGSGADARDPVFIVGLPRSGSTLIEQILASHSFVEGTMELPDIGSIARRLGGRRKRGDASVYPEVLTELDPDALRELGEEYLERTRIQRKTDRPVFIDKMPNNFAHVGLIHLILPNAKIIDARRHPLGCGFSCFKQHFARGQAFTYDLVELGRYYADYVRLMAHFDAVLPGRVHRVNYEELVSDPDTGIRRLLDYCSLPFEQACLSHHSNPRPVRTASSEQVRQPIYTEGLEHWKHYELWLGPMKDALGPVLEAYPSAPAA
jgi:tetratricopeptide (TPR) repeat protein